MTTDREEATMTEALTQVPPLATFLRPVLPAAALQGAHRDLITCSDIQIILSRIAAGSDSNGDTLAFPPNYTSTIPLPSHCINE